MEVADAQRFAQVAEEDYDRRISVYLRLVEGDPHEAATEDLRDARADVLAAQHVLELARLELRWAQQDQREREATEAALRAHDEIIRERRRREREDRVALDRAGEEEAGR